jgi:hypothetical protein
MAFARRRRDDLRFELRRVEVRRVIRLLDFRDHAADFGTSTPEMVDRSAKTAHQPRLGLLDEFHPVVFKR